MAPPTMESEDESVDGKAQSLPACVTTTWRFKEEVASMAKSARQRREKLQVVAGPCILGGGRDALQHVIAHVGCGHHPAAIDEHPIGRGALGRPEDAPIAERVV